MFQVNIVSASTVFLTGYSCVRDAGGTKVEALVQAPRVPTLGLLLSVRLLTWSAQLQILGNGFGPWSTFHTKPGTPRNNHPE